MLPPMLAQMGASFAGGVGRGVGDAISGGPGGPLVSGGGTNDARSFMDGSGWTVSTGRSTARGGTVGPKSQDRSGPADMPPTYGDSVTHQAGVSPMAVGLLLAAGAGAWLIARRKR